MRIPVVMTLLIVGLGDAKVAAALGTVCPGDCAGDGRVQPIDLERGIELVFDTYQPARCRRAAFDGNGDGRTTAADIVAAVRSLLGGCGASAPTTATATATATPLATPLPTSPVRGFFTDVTAEAGLAYRHGYTGDLDDLGSDVDVQAALFAGGVAAGDFDDDGWIDLYVIRGDIGPNLLLRNRGDGTFEDVAAAAGVAIDGARGAGPMFADFDGDNRLDLFVGGVAGTPMRLYRNVGGGGFVDVTAAAGLDVTYNTFGFALADYDGDGDLDLLMGHWGTLLGRHPVDHLWRNDGDGTFTAVSVVAGLGDLVPNEIFDFTFTPNFADLDDDGWPDIAFASDFGTSRVFLNNRDGTFRNVTTDVISDENGMGAALGDFDGDGRLDWFVSSIWDPSGVAEGNWGVSGNRLYRNLGGGAFADVTDAAGVRQGYWGWAACFADFDNDGHLDLFQVNGAQLERAVAFHDDPSRLFMANGDDTFSERAAELGIEDCGQGRGLVCFDYDGDGDIDIFIANNGQPPRLLRNDGGGSNGSVSVTLHGRAPNTDAIGARVELTAAGRTQTREVRAGNNYVSQDPFTVHFGVGAAEVAALHITWPDGSTTQMDGVRTDGAPLRVEQPE